MNVPSIAACLLLLSAAFCHGGITLHVSPTGGKGMLPLSALRKRLPEPPIVTEVVLHKGVYFGGVPLTTPKAFDPKQHPLLIRAAGDGEVVLDGSAPLRNATPVEGMPGVYAIAYRHRRAEPPRVWETDTRTRYTAVADLAAVAHFPGTLTYDRDKLYLHTSDGKPPSTHEMGRGNLDYGLFINRPYVTVRGLNFRNFRVRRKWSTAIDLRTDHITVENCRASNCSLAYIVTGSHNRVLDCRAEDVGGGVYVGGEHAIVRGCRILKKRDSFMIRMYSQDDTGIQYYHPARHGVVRGNLCVGFRNGVFVKAKRVEYVV